MEEYQALINTIALTMGLSWASGINLYAALLVLGVGGATGNIDLPPDLRALQDPLVIMAAGAMYAVEFFADKTPGVDSGWDTLHTFVRIPAGAMLAAGAVGDVTPTLEIAAGILGGGMAATSHATKAGTRLLINTSPEPVTNWIASFSEDVLVLAGLWAALNHPVLFLLLLLVFLALAIWLLPKIFRAIKLMARKLGQWLGLVDKDDTSTHSLPQQHYLERLSQLKQLLDQGALTAEEFETEKALLLRQRSQGTG
ncbi:MAG: hypothetical protein CMK83_07140 [Pseudomonadales bacterium]|uniref:DUF4126 family protein n=1 Tax=unclassified Ketobacter TaxID=2639109 RepID=UPI000C95C7F5|nr:MULTISPECIES: DUF4126 family protein [unclassified Ketobacter]MAQ23980.1 hypothetical protein [Pseudomonadales bacterium]MEC8813828.1 DUF4126 family protein [Pseudomonadota bacterium]TNC88489.1 MAG: hypothetical protein CSH49_11305 [Alcanivorax sp.]HAG96561.1 hypothetical protein [Gammaproteobacteria bacterium]MCK5790573.1 DUF4126 family protein [Ketobacter sp.]